MPAIATEADLLRTLSAGVWTLDDLYAAAEAHDDGVLAERANGRDVVHGQTDTRFRRRVRGALQSMQRAGTARRLGRGRWVVTGTKATRRTVLLLPGCEPDRFELQVADAADLLRSADGPIDLVCADPPWALDRDIKPPSSYARDNSKVIGGYHEWSTDRYQDHTTRWMAAAVDALRPGAFAAVIVGPSRAADVEIAARNVDGFELVNRIVARKPFGVYATRRFVTSHTCVLLFAKDGGTRTFHPHLALVKHGAKGHPYAEDVWDNIPRYQRRGLLRYDNALPPALVERIVETTTDLDDLVADPFLGSGTTATVCLAAGRRFLGGDVNPRSIEFTQARILAEELGVGDPQLTLAGV